MASLKISHMMYVFAGIVTCGLVVSIGLQKRTLGQLEIGGPSYDRITTQKDLLGDILPPPLFVSQAYGLAYEGNFHPEKRAHAIEQIKALQVTFEERKAFWDKVDLPADERAILTDKIYPISAAFWDDMNNEVIPALGGTQEQMDPIFEKLVKSFYAQQDAIMELNTAVSKDTAAVEAEEKASGHAMEFAATIGSVFSVLLFLAGIAFVNRRAIRALSVMTAYMGQLAKGDYSAAVPYADRTDEIGEMAAALEVFKAAGLEKIRLEEEAASASVQRRIEREAREAESAEQAGQILVVVEQLGAGLQRLADCNIQMTIDDPFVATFEKIRNDFNASIAAFQLTLEKVMQTTGEIQDSSSDMQGAAEGMAKRTEQQAAALEQTSAALEEITVTVNASSKSAEDTKRLVDDARSCAVESTQTVADAVSAMQRIENSSREISQIIGVIDEIAFQTNLLALNAGVEAARAGEAGRGFAVVAQEVRELAQRSATAAKQIKGLINNSGQEVATGVRLVGDTGSALSRIQDFVTSIKTNIDSITKGIGEQSIGLKEIATAMAGLDQMTQQNAGMAEQTAALSASVAQQAITLAQQVSHFKLNRRAVIRTPEMKRNYRRSAAA